MGALKDIVDLAARAVEEHASAGVLEKHLALLKDQAALSEAENAKLRKENAELRQTIEILRHELQARANERNAEEVSEGALRVLRAIYDHDGQITLEWIVANLGMTRPEAELHIRRLWDRSFISEPGDGLDDPPGYQIRPDGTEYVLAHR